MLKQADSFKTMSAKKKEGDTAPAKKKQKQDKLPDNIITVAELKKLSDEEKQAFRDSGGTVASDPE